MRYFFLLFVLASGIAGCHSNIKNDASVIVYADQIISEGYIGNGVEWDPYQLDYGHGRMEISEAYQHKVYSRLDFMQPKLIRVMMSTTSLIRDGKLVPETNIDHISWILIAIWLIVYYIHAQQTIPVHPFD